MTVALIDARVVVDAANSGDIRGDVGQFLHCLPYLLNELYSFLLMLVMVHCSQDLKTV